MKHGEVIREQEHAAIAIEIEIIETAMRNLQKKLRNGLTIKDMGILFTF